MARRRRIIRFAQGPLAGQYRYVGAGGNCVQPPQGMNGITPPKMTVETFRGNVSQRVSPKLGVQGPRIPDCLGRQTNADRNTPAQIKAFNTPRDPWTTRSDVTGDIGENFWIGLAVWGGEIVTDFIPGIIPIITPGDEWDDIEGDILPPPPPGTPPPPR